MKKRMGFVSNSSSSSFILGIAVIEDEDKFNKWWESMDRMWCDCDVSITTIHDLVNQRNSNVDIEINVDDKSVAVSCFRGDTVSLSLDGRKDTDRVLIVDIVNNEGDCGFISNHGDIDYGIDVEFLGAGQNKLYDGMQSVNNGLSNSDVRFGAARNG